MNAMHEKEQEKLQSILALGWAVLLILFLGIVLSQLMQAAIADDFIRFAQHPAQKGWEVSCIFIGGYGLMSVLTKMLEYVWFRWLNAALLAVVTISMLHHHVQHMMEGMIYGLTALIDLAHHAIGILMTIQAIRWARAGSKTGCLNIT
jgi:hypothetical protein